MSFLLTCMLSRTDEKGVGLHVALVIIVPSVKEKQKERVNGSRGTLVGCGESVAHVGVRVCMCNLSFMYVHVCGHRRVCALYIHTKKYLEARATIISTRLKVNCDQDGTT